MLMLMRKHCCITRGGGRRHCLCLHCSSGPCRVCLCRRAPPHRRRPRLFPGAWLWLGATSLQAQAEAWLLGFHTNRDDDEALLPPRDATAIGQAEVDAEATASSASGVLAPPTFGLSLHIVDASTETTSMPRTPVLRDSAAHLASQLLATISSSSKSESSNESTHRLFL